MPRLKQYEPHCPSPNCTSGHEHRLHPISGKPDWLPLEVWSQIEEGEILYRCNYCGLVWFQSSARRPGFNARPIGYYDDFQNPRKFVPIEGRYTIREQNTSNYWEKRKARLRKHRKRKLK